MDRHRGPRRLAYGTIDGIGAERAVAKVIGAIDITRDGAVRATVDARTQPAPAHAGVTRGISPSWSTNMAARTASSPSRISIEQIVGDIEDEHDVGEEPLFRADRKLGLVADARTPIEDLEQYLGIQLIPPEQEEDIDTLGGLVFSLSGRIPARGELVRHESGIVFEVLDADRRRIKKLRIRVPDKAELPLRRIPATRWQSG